MNFIRKNKEKPNKNSDKALDLPPSLPLPSFSLDVSVPGAAAPRPPATPLPESSPSSSTPPLYAKFARGTFELREPELLSPSSPRQTLRHHSSTDSGAGFRSSGVRDEVERLVVAKRNVTGIKSGRDSPSIKAPSIRSIVSGRDSPLPSLSEAVENAYSQPRRTISQSAVVLPRPPTPPPPSPPKIIFAKALPTIVPEKSLPATPPPAAAPPPTSPSPIIIPKTPLPKTIPLSSPVSSPSSLLSSPTTSPASRRRAYSPLAAFHATKDNVSGLTSDTVDPNSKNQETASRTSTAFSSISTSTSTPTTPASTLFLSSSETTETSTPSSPYTVNSPTKDTLAEFTAESQAARGISATSSLGFTSPVRTTSVSKNLNKNIPVQTGSSGAESESSPTKGPSFVLRERGYFAMYPDREKIKKTIENFDSQHKTNIPSPVTNGEPVTPVSTRPSKSSISTVDDDDPNLQAFVKGLPSSVSRHTTGDSETSSIASNILASATFGETNRRIPRGARLSRIGGSFNNGNGPEDISSPGLGLGSASPVQTLSRRTSESVFDETPASKPTSANGSTSTLNTLSTHSRDQGHNSVPNTPSKVTSKLESVRDRVRALEEEREREREKERLRRSSPWVRKDGTVGTIKHKKEEKERNGSRSVSSSTLTQQASSPISAKCGEDVNSLTQNGRETVKDAGPILKPEVTVPSFTSAQSESPVSTVLHSEFDQFKAETQALPERLPNGTNLPSLIPYNNLNTLSQPLETKALPVHPKGQSPTIEAVDNAINRVGAGALDSDAPSATVPVVSLENSSVLDTVHDIKLHSTGKPQSISNRLRSGSTFDLDDDPFVRGPLVRQGIPMQTTTLTQVSAPIDVIDSADESSNNDLSHPVKVSAEVDGNEESVTSAENPAVLNGGNDYEISNKSLPLTPSTMPAVNNIKESHSPVTSVHVSAKHHKHSESVVTAYSNESDSSKSEEIEEDVEEENIADDEYTPSSPPYPLERHLCHPYLFHSLLKYLSYTDVLSILALNHSFRRSLTEIRDLREEILERFLHTVGYSRWIWEAKEPLVISLKDLNAYLRGVSTPMHEYATIADAYLAQQAGNTTPASRILRSLSASCRSYTRLAIRLREHAEAEYVVRGLPHPPTSPGPPSSPTSLKHSRHLSIQSTTFSADSHDSTNQYRASNSALQYRKFSSPLFRLHHAPLLRVFVPSANGAWLSDESVLECEKELKRAGVLPFLRPGDVVWDTAVAEEMNAGRLVWDGSYLIDLDYSYTLAGEMPRYLHSLSFPPSYFHKVIQANGNPLCQIDISPWGAEIINNVQLVQDKVMTNIPQGAQHSVLRWTHRSRLQIVPGTPIPESDGLTVDSKWVGTVVVETEGTNEGLGNLLGRCGEQVAAKADTMTGGLSNSLGKGDVGRAFRLIRSKSRPGEIWLRCVSEKEKLV